MKKTSQGSYPTTHSFEKVICGKKVQVGVGIHDSSSAPGILSDQNKGTLPIDFHRYLEHYPESLPAKGTHFRGTPKRLPQFSVNYTE